MLGVSTCFCFGREDGDFFLVFNTEIETCRKTRWPVGMRRPCVIYSILARVGVLVFGLLEGTRSGSAILGETVGNQPCMCVGSKNRTSGDIGLCRCACWEYGSFSSRGIQRLPIMFCGRQWRRCVVGELPIVERCRRVLGGNNED